MSQFIFTNSIESQYKKAYKQHYDKLYPLFGSKEVEIDGKVYVLVGQWRLRKYPLPSDFDIFDKDGNSASESIGRKMHDYIARITVTKNMISKVREPLAKLAEESIQLESIKESFSMDETEITQLTQSMETVDELIDPFIHLVEELLEKDHWNEADMLELENRWNIFMNAYESRVFTLLNLYEQQSNHIKGDTPYENSAASYLWQEVQIVYDTYKLFNPLRAKVGSFSMDELIAHNYRYGRFRHHDEPMKQKNKLGRGMYWFVLYFYRFSVWLFIPFLLYSLWLDDSLTYESGIPIILFGVIGFNIKNLNKYYIIVKVNTKIAERRAALSQEKVKNENGMGKEINALSNSMTTPKVLYKTKAFIYHLYYIIIGSLIIFLIPPVYTYIFEDLDVRWFIYPVLVGVVFTFITIYPFQVLSRKRFVITETAIYIGSRKFSVPEIKNMRLRTDKNILYIYVTYTDNPVKLRVLEENNMAFTESMETFCDKYYLPLEKKA